MFSNFYEAWKFLEEHRIYKDKEFGLGHFERCLDIDVVKVNPINDIIEDDESLNTKTQVWLESGSYEDEDRQGCHDYDLDCGANTFEEAVMKLATLVYLKFGA
jgi:hypothetical protein